MSCLIVSEVIQNAWRVRIKESGSDMERLSLSNYVAAVGEPEPGQKREGEVERGLHVFT